MALVRATVGHDDADREDLQAFLLDLLDPVLPGEARVPLKKRGKLDEGLMMRWIFGEPEETFEIRWRGNPVEFHSPASKTPVDLRHNFLEMYRDGSLNTIFRGRKEGRPTGGVARERLYEIIDWLTDAFLGLDEVDTELIVAPTRSPDVVGAENEPNGAIASWRSFLRDLERARRDGPRTFGIPNLHLLYGTMFVAAVVVVGVTFISR
jgi:hypothetical protein